MVIDSSALVAILSQEPEAVALASAVASGSGHLLSTATWVETSIVILRRFGEAGLIDLDRFVAEAGIELVPVTADHARLARDAFLTYGKGRHAAALNYGDCFTYALAKATSRPLLCKGDDFGRTDIEVVQVVAGEGYFAQGPGDGLVG